MATKRPTKQPNIDPIARYRMLSLARAELARAKFALEEADAERNRTAKEWAAAAQRAASARRVAEAIGSAEAWKMSREARDDLERTQGAVISACRAYSEANERRTEARKAVSRLRPR